MRIRSFKKTVAALIFQSSRIVLTGVPHPDKAQNIAQKVLRRIQHTQNKKLAIQQLRVVNVVGVETFAKRICVERLAKTMGGIYDPSIFPALRCKLDNGTTCLIYISGKVIVTGVKSIDLLKNSFELLSTIVPKHFR
ncbi:hypothetical protein niasHS_017200 [Heterodera schachtii]|uniref:Uncharacterized protein n=1 Tax=Heterodera schachtii TaxID=97005 RepID=A0ABD2IDV2_HETSC